MKVLDHKYYPLALFLIAIVLAIASYGLPWPGLLLVAYGPLFALVAIAVRAPYFSPVWLSVTGMLLAAILTHACAKALLSPGQYGLDWVWVFGAVLVPFLSFALHATTQRHARNKIGWYALAIFWVALEYQSLRLGVQRTPLLGDLPAMPSPVMKWSRFTGLLGVTFWLLACNAAAYGMVFKPDGEWQKIWRWERWVGFLIIACLPALVTYNWPGQAVDYKWLSVLYGHSQSPWPDWLGFYAENGEYFGRTATWVSLLMLIFVFVKHKTR